MCIHALSTIISTVLLLPWIYLILHLHLTHLFTLFVLYGKCIVDNHADIQVLSNMKHA